MTVSGDIRSDYDGLGGDELLRPLIRQEFPGRIALVSSFGAESAVLLHMIAQIDPETPVIFLDTGKLFEETLEHRDRLVNALGLRDVRTIQPREHDTDNLDPKGSLWQHAPDLCCQIRKVEPLERALQGFQAWITGRKRFHGTTRSSLPSIEMADWRVKVNPLANWSPTDVSTYMKENDLPAHPLVALGFPSIGCAPCTSPVREGDDVRSGRWAGEEKTECGIHWTANGKPIRINAGA